MSDLFSIERVVTALSPLLAAAAAALCGWAGGHTGVHLDPGAVEGVEIAAILGTFGTVIKWLHGRQIPAIVGLHISQAQLDELHKEIDGYLAQRAPETSHDIDQLVEALAVRLGRPPPSAEAPKAATDTAPTA